MQDVLGGGVALLYADALRGLGVSGMQNAEPDGGVGSCRVI